MDRVEAFGTIVDPAEESCSRERFEFSRKRPAAHGEGIVLIPPQNWWLVAQELCEQIANRRTTARRRASLIASARTVVRSERFHLATPAWARTSSGTSRT